MDDRKENITAKVIELAAEQGGVEPSQVFLETHFVNDLHYDSLDKVEFAMSVEDEFEMSVPDEAAVELHTVEKVVEYVLVNQPSVVTVE